MRRPASAAARRSAHGGIGPPAHRAGAGRRRGRRPVRWVARRPGFRPPWARGVATRAAALVTRPLATPGRVELPAIGRALEASIVPVATYERPRDPERAAFDADALPSRLVVRARRRGDRLIAFGGGERRLKSLLIDTKIPRWERARVPIVEANGEIVWVAGLRRAATAPVMATTRLVFELRLVALA